MMAYFLVEKRRGANMSQEKLHQIINMAGRILLSNMIMKALLNQKLEVRFLTKKAALSYIIKKCFTIRMMEVRMTRKIYQSK